MKTVSIVIPTYEMHGQGPAFLRFNFEKFTRQTFTDFDVVISDNSSDDSIKQVCDEYHEKLDIHYFVNESTKRTNASANTNNGIRHATGKILKILFMDDFFYDDTSLEKMVAAYNSTQTGWLATACLSTTDGITYFRPFTPRYYDRIHLERNTISSPSVIMIPNDKKIFFDENLTWSMDTDFYRRCHDVYGDPTILTETTVVNRLSPYQLTNTVANEAVRQKEYRYVLNKYKVPHAHILFSIYVIKRAYRELKYSIKRYL